jgi:hypothetical protein
MASHIERRKFLATLGGAAAWPIAARAQQPAKLPTIGLLVPGTPASHGQWFAVLVQRLRELGWIEGRTVAIELRWAEGRVKGLAEIAAEFVRLKVDVIVTSGTPAVVQAMQATSVIPIISAVMGDPVATGLIASLARPGGNITGLSVLAPDLGGKRLGDAILGLVASDMGESAPRWLAIRNVSDPQIKADGLTLRQQAMVAAQIYKGFGRWSSVCSAITCWASIAAE